MMNIRAIVLSVSTVFIGALGHAQELTVFQAGQPASAADVNSNFAALKAALGGASSVSSRAFKEVGDPDKNCQWTSPFNTARGYFIQSQASGCTAVASIQLPAGEVLDSLKCSFFHGEEQTANHAAVRLMSVNLENYSEELILETFRTEPVGRQQVEGIVRANHTVDNSTNAYYLAYLIEDASVGDRMTLFGCSVE